MYIKLYLKLAQRQFLASFAGTGLYKLISSDPAASSLSDENDNSANMSTKNSKINNGT